MAEGCYFEAQPGQLDDPLSVVSACAEASVDCVLVDRGALPDAFFDLSTNLAGELLNKLSNYRIRMAAVVSDPSLHSSPFQSFAREANRGRLCRFFATRDEAIEWLEWP